MRKLIVVLALVLAGCRSKPTNVFIDPALATLVPSDTVFSPASGSTNCAKLQPTSVSSIDR